MSHYLGEQDGQETGMQVEIPVRLLRFYGQTKFDSGYDSEKVWFVRRVMLLLAVALRLVGG